MSPQGAVSTCALPPSMAWSRLVERSIKAWSTLYYSAHQNLVAPSTSDLVVMLQSFSCLDDFFNDEASCMFWFFQRKEAFLAQRKMKKWSTDTLDDFVLLPATRPYVSKKDCLFASHYWRTREDPDPDGEYLRAVQGRLSSQEWSYIWVDWTCAPQAPRKQSETQYFARAVESISDIVRNCRFIWYYPRFEARLWVLYEVAESALTSTDGLQVTPDIAKFVVHTHEMVRDGVRAVLHKYNYRCTSDEDKAFLTSWLEVLVLFKRLQIDVVTTRLLLADMTQTPKGEHITMRLAQGWLELQRYEGMLKIGDQSWTFTPFARERGLATSA